MKTSLITLPIMSLFCLLFFGCTQKSSLKDLEIKDGLYYLKGVSTPYSGKFISKYPTDKDSIVGSVKDGKFDGTVTVYFDNGNIKDEIEYKMGELISTKSFSEDGKPVCDCSEITFDEGKDLWMKINGTEIFSGTCVSYWDNKNRKSSMVVKNGKVREESEWYNNGNVKKILIIDEEGYFKSKTYGYENGNTELKSIYVNHEISSKEKWYENGNKMFVHNYVDGNRASLIEGWYEDGTPAYHVESQPDGPMVLGDYFIKKHDIKSIIEYLDRIQFGKGKSYSQNGDVIMELFYPNEIKVRCVQESPGYDECRELEVITSVRYIKRTYEKSWTEFDDTKLLTPRIKKIFFYTKNCCQSIVISGRMTTLENALNYSNNDVFYPKYYLIP